MVYGHVGIVAVPEWFKGERLRRSGRNLAQVRTLPATFFFMVVLRTFQDMKNERLIHQQLE